MRHAGNGAIIKGYARAIRASSAMTRQLHIAAEEFRGGPGSRSRRRVNALIAHKK
jgi:hypothetical protein